MIPTANPKEPESYLQEQSRNDVKYLPMELFAEIISSLPEGEIRDVCIGLNWTAVVVDVGGNIQCGLASTLGGTHDHSADPGVPMAGQLLGMPSSALLADIDAGDSPRMSLAMATLNATLPRQPETWTELNAVDVIVDQGREARIALIGHFPFVDKLRARVDHLDVIDYNPLKGDLPAEAAPEVLPNADFVAITGLTLLNGTFDSLLALCSPRARVMMLGPSTPLSPVMFDHGVDILAGSIVENIEEVLRVVSQGGNFRQVRKAGVRLVTQTG